jgi:hypothetical protein
VPLLCLPSRFFLAINWAAYATASLYGRPWLKLEALSIGLVEFAPLRRHRLGIDPRGRDESGLREFPPFLLKVIVEWIMLHCPDEVDDAEYTATVYSWAPLDCAAVIII